MKMYLLLSSAAVLNIIAFLLPGKLKILNIAALIFLAYFWIYFYVCDLRYPPVHKLKITNGIIHHPTYGDYPQKVEFHQGMSLMPGQEAVVGIPFTGRKEFKWPKDQ